MQTELSMAQLMKNMTPNEIRQIVGMKPISDPKADELDAARKKMIASQIEKGCDRCSQWDEYFGCDKCERI